MSYHFSMNQGDVLFQGKFDLNEALNSFATFATQIEARLIKLNKILAGEGTAGGKSPLLKNAEQDINRIQGLKIQADKADRKRESDNAQAALQERLKVYKEAKALTDKEFALRIDNEQKAAAIRRKIREIQAKDEKALSQAQEKDENERFARQLKNAENEAKNRRKIREAQNKDDLKAAEEQAKLIQKIFTGLTVGGFALQRFGTFLERSVSEPLKNIIKQFYDTAIAVNDFEETLRVRGGKSKDQIEEIYKVVKRVSDLPNLERSDVLTIFTRLTEVTKGGLTSAELEKIGQGLSKITTSLEAGEKRAFYGQLQDILGGGNVANIEKTLSLVPLLKSKYDELKKAGTIDPNNQKLLVTAALQQLGDLPNVDTIATSVKRLRNEIFEFQRRLGNIYKEELKQIVDFVINKVFPIIDKLIDSLEHASKPMRLFVLSLVGLGVILPPLISTIGSFAIAIGGVGFALQQMGIQLVVVQDGMVLYNAALLEAVINIGLIVAPLTLVIGLLGYFYLSSKDFSKAVNKMGENVAGLVGQLGKFADALERIGQTTSKNATPAQKAGLFASASAGVGVLLGGLTELLDLIVNFPAKAGLGSLTAVVNFFVDAFSVKFPIALERAHLALLQLQKDIENSFPLLKDVNNLIRRMLGGESYDKLIEQSKQRLKELGDTTVDFHKKNSAGLIDAVERHKRWNEEIKASEEAIKKVTAALEAQKTAAVEATIAATQSIADYQSKKKVTGITDEVRGLRGEAFALDLSDPEQAKKALEKIQQSNILNLKAAQLSQQSTYQHQLSEIFKTNRDALVDLAKDEANDTVKDFYVELGIEYAKLEAHPEQSKNIEKTIEGILLKAAVVLDDRTYSHIKQAFDIQRQRIAQVRKLATTIVDDVDAAKKDNQDQLDILQNKQNEIQKRRDAYARNAPLYGVLSARESTLRQAEEERKRLTEDKNALIDIAKLNQDITDAAKKSIEAEKNRALAERALIDASADTNIDKEEKIDKLNKETDKNIQKIIDDARKQYDDFIFDLVHDKAENSKRLRQLLVSFGDELKATINDMAEFAAHGIQPDIAKLNSALEQYNHLVQETVDRLTNDALSPLSNKFGVLEKFRTAIPSNFGQLEQYNRFLDQLKATAGKSLTKDEINNLLTSGEAITNLLQNLLNFTTDPNQAAQATVIIKALTTALENLKAAKEAFKDVKDIKTEIDKVDLAGLEHQQKLNDILKEQLDLEEQILQVRNERGYNKDLPILSKLFQIISGSQKALDDARLKIIENEKKAAELQLEIDLKRLEVEEFILETKIKETPDHEKALKDAQDLYDLEVEQLKKKGALEQELLDEKLKSLKGELGGGTGLFDVIIDIFKKKKKKVPPTGTVDKDGNIIVNGNDPEKIDPDAINAGVLPDSVANQTGSNTDKILGHLGRLRGGLGKVVGGIFQVTQALVEMNLLTKKGILQALAAELEALSRYATIKALEMAARAATALISGDFATAKRAAIAAAAWTAVAIAAKAAAGFLGGAAGGAADNAQSSASSAAGVPAGNTYDPNKDTAILKQQALSVLIQLDIRTDDGMIIKKNIKALNENTDLTNLTLNSQDGWLIAPTP